MGAKQSKRSVDISGKEAEGASEVAAAGAGGEGRVEPLADADALKPQLNGDAHINEKTDKEKDLDSGTPENEKDATTEKETKQEEDKDAAPVTNGETEQKVENGETTPTSEDGKKPKKEKVKKKWSLRSISFSRKDKPKQEKKKEDEAKTNGEPEKVPEETNEVAPEAAEEATTEESKSQSESKPEEKTPETPVTEPITNGTATPESPKIETPPTEELVPEVASPAAASPEVTSPAIASPEVVSPTIASPEIASPEVVSPEHEMSEPKPVVEPEQLPINGLSLEDSKESLEVEQSEESKPEEPAAEKTEIVPETPVIKEVCVDQMPLIEPTPPPLPANPPPSSVASFAATTMAPELTDASLANTADTAIPTLPADSITKDAVSKIPSEPTNDLTGTFITESSIPSKPIDNKNLDSFVMNEVVLENGKAIDESVTQDTIATQESEIQKDKEIPTILNEIEKEVITEIPEVVPQSLESTLELIENKPNVSENIEISVQVETSQSPVDKIPEGPKSPISSLCEGITETQISEDVPIKEPSELTEITDKSEVLENTLETSEETKNKTNEACEVTQTTADIITVVSEAPEIKPEVEDGKNVAAPTPDRVEEPMDIEVMTNSCDLPAETDVSQNDSSEELPPPPPPICDDIEDSTANMDEDIDSISEKAIIETTEVLVNSNHAVEVGEIVPLDNEVSKDNAKQLVGKIAKDALGNVIECNGNTEEEESAPEETPAAPSPVPQEPLPTCDKISELIPEVPAIPEFKSETESPSDVAVAVAN